MNLLKNDGNGAPVGLPGKSPLDPAISTCE